MERAGRKGKLVERLQYKSHGIRIAMHSGGALLAFTVLQVCSFVSCRIGMISMEVLLLGY
jgi:hypothetical protein